MLLGPNYGTFTKPSPRKFMQDTISDTSTSSTNFIMYSAYISSQSDLEHVTLKKCKCGKTMIVQEIKDSLIRNIYRVSEGDLVIAINGKQISEASFSHPTRHEPIHLLILKGETIRQIQQYPIGGTSLFILYHTLIGESLAKVAELFAVDVLQIRSDNRSYFPIGESAELEPDSLLKIRDNHFQNIYTTKDHFSCKKSHSRSEGTSESLIQNSPRCIFHEVVPEETLANISKKYGVSQIEIRRMNRNLFPIGEQVQLWSGMVLRIFLQNT